MAQAIISHGVHGPCPKNMLETAAVIEPTMAPAKEPKTSPTQMIRKVQGLILGRAANGMREAAVMAASMPISATSLELILDSSNLAKRTARMKKTNMMERKAA